MPVSNIAVCISEAHKEDIQSILYPLIVEFRKAGKRAVVFNCCNDLYNDTPFNEAEASVYELIPYSSCSAVIIFAQYIKNEAVLKDIIRDSLDSNIPVIVVDGDVDYENCINLRYNFSDAFSDLMSHLLDHHKLTKINCIAGFKDNRFSDERVTIYKKALAEHGIPFEEERFGYGNFYDLPTIEVMERFLASPLGLPEAIVCINDSMAMTACKILAQRGIRVPEDVIVTGFDGIVQEKYHFPRITTCRRDLEKMAEFLLTLVEDASAGRIKNQTVSFPYALDCSESCGCEQKSVADINSSVDFLYNRLNYFQMYDNSMNNMTARLTNEFNTARITETLKYYAIFDCVLCLNSDFSRSHLSVHKKNDVPFTPVMNADQYFHNMDTVPHFSFPLTELIPERCCTNDTDPVIIFAIHSQDNINGYLCAFITDKDFNTFSRTLHRLNRFATNLDTCIGFYVQKRSLKKYNTRLKGIQNKIISSFADLVESRDDFTGQHIKRTSEYLRILVEKLATDPKYKESLTYETAEIMIKTAPLHDIGKIKIPDNILNKPGKLTDDEFDIIKTHTVEGHDIIHKTLTNIESPEYITIAGHMALYHHEKWDGSGYPCRLAGEDIPLCARMMAVVDVFDALTSKRVYKDAFSTDLAFKILEESKGTHFDPDVVSAFIEMREKVEQVLDSHK